MLAHNPVEEIDGLVQFQLANVLKMLLAGQRQHDTDEEDQASQVRGIFLTTAFTGRNGFLKE